MGLLKQSGLYAPFFYPVEVADIRMTLHRSGLSKAYDSMLEKYHAQMKAICDEEAKEM